MKLNTLFNQTPQTFKDRAIKQLNGKVKFLTIAVNKGRYYFDIQSSTGAGKYRVVIYPLKKDGDIKKDDVIINCSCPDFMYREETVLWNAGVSRKINSNGALPLITNPSFQKRLCKHCIATILYLKKYNRL